MNNYKQLIVQYLAETQASRQFTDEEFRLLDQYTRYIAMLDCPTPKLQITCWICNQFNLLEEWYRWEQAGRLATAKLKVPDEVYQEAVMIVAIASSSGSGCLTEVLEGQQGQ